MAFALRGFGSGSLANSATANQASLVITTTTTAGVSGDLAVVCYAVDNSATVDGDEGAVTAVTDSGGNLWVKAVEFTNSQAAAQAGATCGVWYSNLTAALAIGSTITLTFSAVTTRDASAANVSFWTKGAGTFATVEATSSLANTAALAGSLDATTANIECLRIRAIASESITNTLLTKTAAFTAVMPQAIASTVMAIRGEYLISTSTGQASAPTAGAGAVDNASVYVAFKEVIVTGTLATTEAQDVAVFAGRVGPLATLATTEATDVAAFAGGVIVAGTLATIEATDSFFGDGSVTVPVAAQLAAIEGSDLAGFTGKSAFDNSDFANWKFGKRFDRSLTSRFPWQG